MTITRYLRQTSLYRERFIYLTIFKVHSTCISLVLMRSPFSAETHHKSMHVVRVEKQHGQTRSQREKDRQTERQGDREWGLRIPCKGTFPLPYFTPVTDGSYVSGSMSSCTTQGRLSFLQHGPLGT